MLLKCVCAVRWARGEPDHRDSRCRQPEEDFVPDGEDCQNHMVQPTIPGSSGGCHHTELTRTVFWMVRSAERTSTSEHPFQVSSRCDVSLCLAAGRTMWRPWLTGSCWWGLSWRKSSNVWGPQEPGTTSLTRSACSASRGSIVSSAIITTAQRTHTHTLTVQGLLPTPFCKCVNEQKQG